MGEPPPHSPCTWLKDKHVGPALPASLQFQWFGFGRVVQAWPLGGPLRTCVTEILGGKKNPLSVWFDVLTDASLGLLLATGTMWGGLPESDANSGESEETETGSQGPSWSTRALARPGPVAYASPCCARARRAQGSLPTPI